MNPVNNLPDALNSSGLTNFLASLSASLASGNPVDGLFSDLLSQVQTLALPPPNPPAPAAPQTAGTPSSPSSQSLQASQQSQQSQPSTQDTQTGNTGDTVVATSNPPDTNTSATPAGWAAIGKPHLHKTKSASDKNAPQDTADNHSNPVSSAPPPVPASNGQSSASANASLNPAIAVAATTDEPDDNTSPASDPSTPTVPATSLNEPANVPAAAASTNASSTANASSTPPSVSGSDDTDDAANGGNDVTASQLMLLLMQLEHLAASRLAGMSTTASEDAAATANTQNTNAATAQPTLGTAGDKQAKIDWKALLSQLVGQNNNTGLTDDSATGQTDAAGTSGNTQNAAASAATNASLQNALTNSSPASPASPTADNKWMNGAFLNLFNSAANNQANTAVPFVFNPGAGAVPATTGSDDAALDAGLEDQGGANAHNAAADLQTLNTNLPPATGSSQAASPYDFASQLSEMRAAKGGSTGLPTPIEQVVLQLSRGLSKDGSSQMTIQLRPAELGRVDVKLNIDSSGKVQGTVTADNPATLGLLLKDVRGLERALQEAGLRADSGSLQFNLRGDGQPGGPGGQSTGNQSGFANNSNTSSSSTTSLAALSNPVETYYLTPGGVNFRV